MSQRRDPFGRCLHELKVLLQSGRFVPGQPLSILEIAEHLNLSPTPVREAMAYLSGEGVIGDVRGRGYHCLRLDSDELDELVRLQGALHQLALQRLNEPDAPKTQSTLAIPAEDREHVQEAIALDAEQLFTEIIHAGGGRVLQKAHAAVSLQLGPVRRVEPSQFPDAHAEIRRLALLFDRQQWPVLARELAAYHQRRRRHIDQLIGALRQQPMSAVNI